MYPSYLIPFKRLIKVLERVSIIQHVASGLQLCALTISKDPGMAPLHLVVVKFTFCFLQAWRQKEPPQAAGMCSSNSSLKRRASQSCRNCGPGCDTGRRLLLATTHHISNDRCLVDS